MVGYNPRDDAIDHWSVLVDSNGDDMINFKEFVSLIDMLETDEGKLKEGNNSFMLKSFLGHPDIMTLKTILSSKNL